MSVTGNFEAVAKRLRDETKRYQHDILSSFDFLQRNIRDIDVASFIPKRAGLPNIPLNAEPKIVNNAMSRLRKMQPASRKFLTVRSGLYASIFKAKGSTFKVLNQSAKLFGAKFLSAVVKIVKVPGKTAFTFRMAVKPQGDDRVKFRMLHEIKGDRKGVIRKHLEPAGQKALIKFPAEIQHRVRALNRLVRL